METISYKVELPDPYHNAYEHVIMEFEHRMRSREMEGLEAALKEHGYVKERTCKNSSVGTSNPDLEFTCSACGCELFGNYCEPALRLNGEDIKNTYCPNCGAKVVE